MARRIPTSCGRGPNTSRRARGAWCSLEVERRMGGPVRGIVVVGIALIVLGVVALAWQGITYTSKEKGVDAAPLKAEAERQKTIPVSPAAAGGHFAADKELTQAHIKSGATCIAYETVELPSRELPLLTPMSEVAGRMAVQEGAKYLEKIYGGRGVLLGGVPGVAPGKVVVLGGGIVGINAAKMAAGLGAKVTVLDLSLERLRYLSDVMPANVTLIYSNRHNILEQISTADLVVGAVLIPGAVAPRLIRREDLKLMQSGAVIVDVAIDQGGCVETIKATTHENPTYVVDGIIHYGVANMPGGVPRTSTLALTNATFPYAMQLANKGWKKALKENLALKKGLNIVDGKVTYPAVAEAFALPYTPPDSYLN